MWRAYCDRIASLFDSIVVTNAYGSRVSVEHGVAMVEDLLLATRRHGRKVMVVGNGGSAAIAAHLQNDLCKAVGVRALCFGDLSLVTAVANDHGYECVYERAVRQWGEDSDLLIALSSSGNSENILRAVRAAEESGCTVVTLSGFSEENRLRRMGWVNFYVPAEEYGLVESVHAVLSHFFTDMAQARGRQEAACRQGVPGADAGGRPSLRLLSSSLAVRRGRLARRR